VDEHERWPGTGLFEGDAERIDLDRPHGRLNLLRDVRFTSRRSPLTSIEHQAEDIPACATFGNVM
jgi:hypothetical protein